MTRDRNDRDNPLDPAFAALRARQPQPRPDFMARLTAEALALQPPRPKPVRGQPWWQALASSLGGWRAGMTLAGSALAGAALGYFQPMLLDPLYAAALGDGVIMVSDMGEDPVEALLEEIGS
ncbi:hypothetical protein HMH01_13320 [Halovulum dunhuangense]|uniref:Dihydroorotate dehydrogenase n=1 Tax=Halovulum dunhuangense TaxID=1505036 RepID=A0A849L5M0_9RHOB|nr:hypothetical protein [Halovulum dunhuangense]NNU81417.1 hypothetical protein [Halovulum dunhuangense]